MQTELGNNLGWALPWTSLRARSSAVIGFTRARRKPFPPGETALASAGPSITKNSKGEKSKSNAPDRSVRPTLSTVCPLVFRSFILLLRFIHRYPVHQEQRFFMPKRTFQPNRRHRSKTHGFLTRMKTKAGRAVISRRRAKGRKRVSVKPGFRE